MAREKDRKLNYQAQKELGERQRVREEGMHEGQTVPTQPNLPPMGNSQEETLTRLTRQLENLTLNLMQRPEPPREGFNRGQRRQNQEYQCYNCGETGHGMYNCPHPRRDQGRPMPRGMYPRPPMMARPAPVPALAAPIAVIPPVPPPPVLPPLVEARVVNILGLEKRDEKPRGFEVMPAVKSTRGDHNKEPMGDLDEVRRRDKDPIEQREEGETSKKQKRVKKPRRRITIHDFPLGKDHDSYDLANDLGSQKPNITYPQLLELSPLLRRQWSKIS